ncbi:MAG: putative DNA-binding domain-containing protein [Sphingomonadales bacterium]|nr:putative DNA-binding domain-containing protein [Sphingomonadales bacterium]MBK9002884.1 putative DNA-binding domain-containing protein [Sphingomonadales bacterium]MBK9268132.1 putative DNA-binding domain-containing protein [Sphingomonadales bacterium]MBP6433631.1 putative DNA-binding domain-containing protein [Sphingorhabdus sp.]
MPIADKTQARMIHAINEGPGSVDPGLFEGPPERVIEAFRIHATTIHRARLRVLEHAFSELRRAMGDAAFRKLCDAYVETPKARKLDLNGLAAGFATFLRESDFKALATLAWEKSSQV